MNPECRICNNNDAKKIFIAREKHFATYDGFQYFECPNCLSLQIMVIPENITKYYPDEYYSKIIPLQNPIKIIIKKLWYKNLFNGLYFIGKLFSLIKGDPSFYNWFIRLNLKPDDSILDVGSGIGYFLSELKLAGFNNLTGIDPFINESVVYSKGFELIKGTLKDIAELGKTYRLILLNHSLEHIPEPLQTMKDARKLQKVDDNLVIRIPVSGSFVWEKYGVDWVSLDPPRHFYLLSVKAMEILASKSSYKIYDILYDSSDIQFWGSELYRNNIPMTQTKFGSKDPMKDFRNIITKEQSKEFRILTKELNNEKRGDQATFFLKAI